MKQLTEKFKSQFEFIRENDGRWYYFLVPIKKERDNGKTATYKLKFIDSFRYMPTSLSNIVDNLSEIYKKKFKALHLILKIINYVANLKNVKKYG